MKTLQHQDELLALKSHAIVMASAEVSGVDMHNGGRKSYPAGTSFRVKHSIGGLLWVLDADGATITFDRPTLSDIDKA